MACHLIEFPIHAVKIDPRFVVGVGSDTCDTAIARLVLSLGAATAERTDALNVFGDG